MTAILAAPALAQTSEPSFNLYGVPGLIDMPTANVSSDATLSMTYSRFGDNNRTTLRFQLTPRLSGAFRYSAIKDFVTLGSVNGVYYDRSFDIRYQVLREGTYTPSVVVGLQDFIGTGLYGGEYIVATKTVSPGFQLTGGLGWGRLGGTNRIGSTGTRPSELLGQGGVPTYDRWFRGDVSVFGGLSYAPNQRLTFKAEYSSDNYTQERTLGQFKGNSQWNYGIDYRTRRGTQWSFYYAYGEEIGAQVTLNLNAKRAPVPGGLDTAPIPVVVRSTENVGDLGWVNDGQTRPAIQKALTSALERDGLEYQGFSSDGRRAVLRMKNSKYHSTPQAIGRAMRIMSRVLPPSIEEFVVIPTVNGLGLSAISQKRTDIETLENAPAADILARSTITDAHGQVPALDKGIYPKFTWSLAPYISVSVFDPDNPVRADLGARVRGKYELTPNIVLSGSITKRVTGDLDSITRVSNSTLPLVRTNFSRFVRDGDPALEHLTVTGYTRLGKDLYGRASVGYLESMYGGMSGEVLWKPVNSRLALGAELNVVRQRDFDRRLGFQDCGFLKANANFSDCTLVTGHASAYYDFGGGYHGQLDVGRYLAGDYGATLSLDREFANGWRVGAYATFTDVAFDDFGEGSFDKGIRVTVPVGWFNGTSTRQSNTVRIQSLTRDGGARLNIGGRLYQRVRDYHEPELAKSWGRFWR